MKVGMLTSTEERCGIARYSSELIRCLTPLVDLDVVPTWTGREPWGEYERASVERLNRCDVVHIQHEYSFWGSILPGRNRYPSHISKIRPPKTLTAHTLDTASTMLSAGASGLRSAKSLLALWPGYRDYVERGVFDQADRIIVHDDPTARVLTGRGIDSAKVRVVPMGIPVCGAVDGEPVRERFELRGRRVVTIFGFVRPYRGYEAALAALERLDDDAVLLIAGGAQGPEDEVYLAGLTEGVRSRGMSSRVVVTGYLPESDVPVVMAASDVVLCPQERGTGSYSVQVALGCGRPIVASSLPFFTDLAAVSDALVTFAVGDAADLGAKLSGILNDPIVAARLSSNACGYADARSWGRIAEMTVGVYRELAR